MPVKSADAAIFDIIRQRLRHEYEMALVAVDRVENALGKAGGQNGASGALIRSLASTLSAREAVLMCIVETWMDADEIAMRTGLSSKQVRGVLYAGPIKRLVRKDRSGMNGAIRFQIPESDFLGLFEEEKNRWGADLGRATPPAEMGAW